jgi:S-adenosylmethionine:tRNA ribosyltransferase-isomerase
MRTDLFDFDLPDDRIALQPASPRDAARLLVVGAPSPCPSSPSPRATPAAPQAPVARREGGGEGQPGADASRGQGLAPECAPLRASPAPHPGPLPASGERGPGGAREDGALLQDRHVSDLPGLLRPGDALVLNDTRVIRAALQGERLRGPSRAAVSFNLHKRLDEHRWLAFARPARRLAAGDRVRFGPNSDNDGRVCLLGTLEATVARAGEAGEVELAFSLHSAYLDEAIEAIGDPPLPPYIAARRAVEPGDSERYQTVFARREGAVAAPTAGLHFTQGLLAALQARGIAQHCVTLHVGAGTFLPVKVEDTAEHQMQAEWGEITAETAAALNAVHRAGGRIVAVGTTALRLLETAAAEDGSIRPFSGETALFITPGYRFKAVDLLLTNFHLPRSTLFMLVSAFSGLETMRAAYAHAVREGYRFYSYGDACLLYPAALAPGIPEAEPKARPSATSASGSGPHEVPDRRVAGASARFPPPGMIREGGGG